MATFKAIEDGSAIIAQADGLTRVEARMATRGTLRNIMRPVLATAKELAPKDKGALAASLRLRSIARTRRGIGVLVQTTGALTKAQARKNTVFSGEQFYGSLVHWGHKFVGSAKPTNESIGLRRGQRRNAVARAAIAKADAARTRGSVPAQPFLKDAGEMHRARMAREFETEFGKEVQEVLAKRK